MLVILLYYTGLHVQDYQPMHNVRTWDPAHHRSKPPPCCLIWLHVPNRIFISTCYCKLSRCFAIICHQSAAGIGEVDNNSATFSHPWLVNGPAGYYVFTICFLHGCQSKPFTHIFLLSGWISFHSPRSMATVMAVFGTASVFNYCFP